MPDRFCSHECDGKEAQAAGAGDLHIGMAVAHFFVEGGFRDRQRIR